MNGPRVFGVTGWKNSGKTRMVAALVGEFTRRGLTVSTVKHAHHAFDIDHEGTDSWQHRQAGAREVALVSARRFALMRELKDEGEPQLADILAKLAPCDLVLVEGYKRENHAKMELIRQGATSDKPLWPDDPAIVLIGSDQRFENCPLPVIDPADIGAVADFILAHLGQD